jgi:hypothetical protein
MQSVLCFQAMFLTSSLMASNFCHRSRSPSHWADADMPMIDEHSPEMGIASFGDRAAMDAITAGMLAGDQPAVAAVGRLALKRTGTVVRFQAA